MNRRKLGNEKETVACRYLQDHGFFILERNFWTREGEVDIIAREMDTLVFLEVKYRKDGTYGGAAYAITAKKKRTICRCAMYYQIKKAVSPDSPIRFDVLLMEGDEITLIRNAFEANESAF